jgi:hypothetical protein
MKQFYFGIEGILKLGENELENIFNIFIIFGLIWSLGSSFSDKS